MINLVQSTRNDMDIPRLPWLVVQIGCHAAPDGKFWNSIQDQQRLPLTSHPQSIWALKMVSISVVSASRSSASASRGSPHAWCSGTAKRRAAFISKMFL